MICPVEWANRRTTRKNQKEDKTRRGQKQRQLKKLHQQSYVQLVGQGRHTRGQNTKNKPKLKHRVTQLTQIGRVRGVARRSRLLPALVIWPLTAHLFRDGASFLLLIETPPTFGCSLRFSPPYNILHMNVLLISSPSCFAVCSHHLSPSIGIVFSLPSSVPNFSVSHSSAFFISSNHLFLTHLVPPCTFHIPLCEFYCRLNTLPQGHLCASSSSSRLLVYLFLLWRSTGGRYRINIRRKKGTKGKQTKTKPLHIARSFPGFSSSIMPKLNFELRCPIQPDLTSSRKPKQGMNFRLCRQLFQVRDRARSH